MWGKPRGYSSAPSRKRFTPTGVGKTLLASNPENDLQVHPHRCGENSLSDLFSHFHEGSPPQVWGKLCARQPALNSRRFTPTGVGKTRSSSMYADNSRVHPHRCGENARHIAKQSFPYGSPPQVWGKLVSHSSRASSARFTPTGVGKTVSALADGRAAEVHPHRCGENMRNAEARNSIGGSPPQVWGKLAAVTDIPEPKRFTPTGVGKTAPAYPNKAPRQVHPHRCGENSWRL